MATKEAIAAELFQFLEKKNVKDVLSHITEQMLMYKPNNVVRFIVKTLKNDFPDEATALEEGELRIHETFQLFGEGEEDTDVVQEYDDGTVKRSANDGTFVKDEVVMNNHDPEPRVHISEGCSRTMDKVVDKATTKHFVRVHGNPIPTLKEGGTAQGPSKESHTENSGMEDGNAAPAVASKSGVDESKEEQQSSSESNNSNPTAATGDATAEDDANITEDTSPAKDGTAPSQNEVATDDDEDFETDDEILAQFGHLFPVFEKHVLFASMEMWEWLQICRALEEVHCRKHDIICKQGSGGAGQDFFYIIESGNVEVFIMKDVEPPKPRELSPQEKEEKEREKMRKANLAAMGLQDDVKVTKKKDTEQLIREEIRKKELEMAKQASKRRMKKTLANYIRGDTFGELALLYPSKREASVLVTSPKASFWRLSRRSFKVLSNLFIHERARRRIASINETKIFSTMTDAEKVILADALNIETFYKGDFIIQQGAMHRKLYIIREGDVTISQRNKLGRQVELCRVCRGHAFGEHALITMRPSQASVVTATKVVQCYTLTKAAFIQAFGPMTDIMKRTAPFNSEIMSMLI